MKDRYFRGESFENIYITILNVIQQKPDYVIPTATYNHFRGYREVVNVSFELHNPLDRLVWNRARRGNYDFAMKFFLWMMDGGTDYSIVAGVNPNALNYIETDKVDKLASDFNTFYGPRIKTQWQQIVEELSSHKHSRRATIIILDSEDNQLLPLKTKTEYPCTVAITFFIRFEKLHCQVQMRSNNMATTVVYDVFNFTMMQELMLKQLQPYYPQLKMGTYYHHTTSAHYFIDQEYLVKEILLADKLPGFLFLPEKNKSDKKEEETKK